MAKKNEIPMYYNKHYIRTNDNNHIIDGFSDAFREPTETDICINEHGGHQFRLIIGGEFGELTDENPPLFDSLYIPIYKYINGEIVEVSDEEKAAIVANRPVILTDMDKLEAQVFYTAMETDTLLED